MLPNLAGRYTHCSRHRGTKKPQQQSIVFERSMARTYIEQLSQAYATFFDSYSESPLLRIETDQLDLVQDTDAQDEVIGRITAAVTAKDSRP